METEAKQNVVIILNHIYPDGLRRELIRSRDYYELRDYAANRLGDENLVSMFAELEEWNTERRRIVPMVERLSSSLEIVITVE